MAACIGLIALECVVQGTALGTVLCLRKSGRGAMQEHQDAQESALQTAGKAELAELEQLNPRVRPVQSMKLGSAKQGLFFRWSTRQVSKAYERKMQLRPQEVLGQRTVTPFATMCTQVQLAARQSANRCSGGRMNPWPRAKTDGSRTWALCCRTG